MTIERFHSEEGFSLDPNRSPEDQIMQTVAANITSLQTLPEGDYNLTPAWWTKHLMIHNLTVLENGNGIYKMLPRDNDVGTIEIDPRKIMNQHKPGGRIVHLPQDQEMIVIGGPLKDRKTLGVYEVIFHVPGRSPKK
jgi:hypothetical protein